MPVWLTDDEYRTLSAACDRLIPPVPAPSPGAAGGRCARLHRRPAGRLLVRSARDLGRWPHLGPPRGSGRLRPLPPLSALDELAWRIRIEGSRGLPEREFNGPVVGLQQRYREGLAALGADFCRARTRPSRTPGCGRTPTSPTCSTATPARGCTGPPSTAATATGRAGRPSASPGTSSPGAGPTPRCPTRDRRRRHHRVGPGRGHRGRRAHRGRLDGGHRREGAQPPARPRGPDAARPSTTPTTRSSSSAATSSAPTR